MRLEDIVGGLDTWATRRMKEPVGRAFVHLHLTATQLNFIGLAGCVAAGALASAGYFVASGLMFFASSAIDFFDGTVARQRGTAPTFSLGAWLDAYLGSVGEAALYVGVAAIISDANLLRLLGLALLTTLLTSHAKAVAGEYGIQPDWREAGGVGRGLRILIASAGLVLAGVAEPVAGTIAIATMTTLIGFNLVVLAYRVRKIAAAARAKDRRVRCEN